MSGHPSLRKQLIKHKTFLKALYSEKQGHRNKRRIQKASKGELKTLLRILFCVSHGHIPIKKAHYHLIKLSKRRPKLVHIGSKLKHLIKDSEETQKNTLKQFSSLYQYILHPLFNV